VAYIREDTVEDHWHSEVTRRGGFTYKCTVPGRRNVPDRITMLPLVGMFFVELKAPGKKATPAQLREHKRIEEWGGGVEVFDTKYEINEFLREYDGHAARELEARMTRH